MERLLADLLSWDQEKEDNYSKREALRQIKIDEIKVERKKASEERARIRQEANKKDLEEKEEGEGEGEPAEGDAEAPPEGEGENPSPPDAEENRPKTVEAPIEVTLDGDSDDDFGLIDIKEEVKTYIKEKGQETRIVPEIINKAVRWRLERNDCQNRGYVLDGYPKNFDNADKVFVVTPTAPPKQVDEEGVEIEVDEEALKKSMQPTLQTNIYPESVIVLHTSDQFLKRRSKTLMMNNVQDALKWKVEKLVDKLDKYNGENLISSGPDTITPMCQFF